MERYLWIFIVVAAIFTGLIVANFSLPQTEKTAERTPSYSVSIPDGKYWFGELEQRYYDIEMKSSQDVEVFVFASEEDMNNWVSGKEYSHYFDCYSEATREYRKACVTADGAFMVILNPTTFGFGRDAKVDIYFN